jgi:uncharacterized protein
VVALRWLINARLGVTGGYADFVEHFRARDPRLGWRGWFLIGLLAGTLVFIALTGGDATPDGYGWLTRTFEGPGRIVAGALLLGAGMAIGYGAKTAGGCTAGNGLSGSSLGSVASMIATGTFVATAIGVSFLIKALT